MHCGFLIDFMMELACLVLFLISCFHFSVFFLLLTLCSGCLVDVIFNYISRIISPEMKKNQKTANSTKKQRQRIAISIRLSKAAEAEAAAVAEKRPWPWPKPFDGDGCKEMRFCGCKECSKTLNYRKLKSTDSVKRWQVHSERERERRRERGRGRERD